MTLVGSCVETIFNIFREIGVYRDNPNPHRRPYLDFEIFWLVRKKVFIGQTIAFLIFIPPKQLIVGENFHTKAQNKKLRAII